MGITENLIISDSFEKRVKSRFSFKSIVLMDFPYSDLYRIVEFKLKKEEVNERIIEIILKKIEDDEKVKRFLSMLHACNFSIKWFMELMKLSCIVL